MPYGITDVGFVPKTLTQAKAELEAAFTAAFGVNTDVSAESPFGQIIGIFAEQLAEMWDAQAATYAAFSPDGASATSLDNVCALTGVRREAATRSTLTATVTGTLATVVPAGTKFSVATTGIQFRTTAAGTLAAGTPWASSTGYSVGDERTHASNCYVCITAGTSAGSGGPTTTASDITDGTAHWRYLGGGTALADIACEATDTGPKIAAAYTLTTLDTLVAGVQNVTNQVDAALGEDVESDAALRMRREAELRSGGSGAVDALRSHLLLVADVESATVFENVTDATDGNGLPPHSIECLVLGGDETEIREAIFKYKSAGIQTYGGVSGSVDDSQGIAHTIDFSRPTEKDVWVIINVLADASVWPDTGEDDLKAYLVAYGRATLGTGRDVTASALSAQGFKVAGVLDVTSCLIGLSNPPVASTTLAISLREIAKLDTARITVNVSFGTP